MAIPIVSFTAGGIDVESIVQGLMQVERQPINMLQTRQAKAQLQNDALSRLRSSLDSLKSMAASVVTNGVGKLSSTVSAPSAVTASLSPFARAGSVTFTVDQLARAHGLRSATTVASSSSVITSASTFALSTNANAVGISSVQAGPGVAPGNYTVSVLQATAGATRTGTSPVAASDTDRRHQQHAQPRARRRGDSRSPSRPARTTRPASSARCRARSTSPAVAPPRRSMPPAVSASRRPTRAPPPRSR